MDIIEDGKNTGMRIEEKLDERIRSEDKFNRKILRQNKYILLFTVSIFLLTLALVVLTIR